jgi:hypothetical protein
MLCAVSARKKSAVVCPVEDYWKARGDRAIAASILHAGASLVLRTASLRLRRETLQIQADLSRIYVDLFRMYPDLLRRTNRNYLNKLGRRAADYYRADGRTLQLAHRLGERIDRHSAPIKKLA